MKPIFALILLFPARNCILFTSAELIKKNNSSSSSSSLTSEYLLNSSISSTTLSSETTTEEANYDNDEDYDENENKTISDKRRNRDNPKVAFVAISFFLAILAIIAILIKNAVAQFEASQWRAQQQLTYHRLNSNL